MDWTLFFTAAGAVATIISTIVAVRAKNEAKDILHQIKEERSRNVSNSGEMNITNTGTNSGIVSGTNTGEMHV